MRWTVRRKLVLSHTLPLLFLLPLLALYLLDALEELFNQNLLQQLEYQARILQASAQQDLQIVDTPQHAEQFLAGIAALTDARVLLIAPDTRILGSTRSEDRARIGTRYVNAAVERALDGENVTGFGPGITSEVAYVVLPLRDTTTMRGALRLSYEVEDMRAQFNQLRWTVLFGIALTGLIGLGLALGLATTIIRPLQQLTASVQKIATGDYLARVPIYSQDEVGQLAHNFNHMTTRLEEAEQMRARQLAAVTHELSRPLAGMRAALETLIDFPDADRSVHDALLNGITEEVTRFERLLETLRAVSKNAFRPPQLHWSTTPLDRIINASIANFKPIASKLGITLSVETPHYLPPLRLDEDRLIQVMTNLLDNALKFTPRGGKVAVAIGEDAQSVWVSVEDSGVGIAPEEMPNLFQQFYRGDDSRPPEKSGMGLGLAICREVIAAHGGTIRVESKPGEGSRFIFTLPK